jgi:hypothetical protein
VVLPDLHTRHDAHPRAPSNVFRKTHQNLPSKSTFPSRKKKEMPRGRDECWQEVDRELAEESGKRHPRVTCRHCQTSWTSNEKGRVVEHLQRCNELPEPLWRTYQPNRIDPTLPSAQELQAQQRARARNQGAMTATDQDIATAACAQWINAAGLNATITEHPAFRAFVNTLRPAYKVPDRHQLTRALIDAPLMFIAYLADPQERQRRPAILDGNEEAQSRSLQTFLLKYCDGQTQDAARLLGMLSLLRIKQGPFNNDSFWLVGNQMHPIQWWQNFWVADHPAIAELCILALAIAPSGGEGIERNWSPQDFVISLKRNALSPGLLDRLVTNFWSLRIKHCWVDDPASASADGAEADAPYAAENDTYMGSSN